ncbi:hypothetical protein TPCU411_20680 [Cutibacterium acnes]|nr:hypothetical protein TPCU411_20680 [Cutibacterium acnes]
MAFDTPAVEELPDWLGFFTSLWEEQALSARQVVSATAVTRRGRLGFGNMEETLPRMCGSPKQ